MYVHRKKTNDRYYVSEMGSSEMQNFRPRINANMFHKCSNPELTSYINLKQLGFGLVAWRQTSNYKYVLQTN